MAPVKSKTQEINEPMLDGKYLPVTFQFQLQRRKIKRDVLAGLVQLPFVRAQENQIVNVADVVLNSELLLDEMIKSLQKEVGKPLAGIVSDRQPRRSAVDYPVNQPERFLILDHSSEHGFQNLVIDVLVEFTDVHF